MSGYKIKLHTHNPEVAKNLIGGSGLFDILKQTINNFKDNMTDSRIISVDSPFSLLDKSDFNSEDELVKKHLDNIFHITELPVKEAYPKLVECMNEMNAYRIANYRQNLRNAFVSIQNAVDKNNDVVKLERLASKTEDKSQGHWQIESLKAIDSSLKFASNEDIQILTAARNLVLNGEKDFLMSASTLVKNLFESITPKSNTRLAYTSLSTQDNEPYLMCPKGNFQGKSAVPMEVSKCRENCIDSRVAKDGTVTCAYQDWLKVSFEPQNKVLGRLDYHRHPDNEENLINLKEGERSKKLTEGEFGYEFRFTHNDRGVNKVRNQDKNYDDSIETQLSNKKSVEWGHKNEPVIKAPKQAQSEPNKTINTQLEPSRKNPQGNDYLEALLRKLNKIETHTDWTREEQLEKDGLQANRGEMEESYPQQLEDKKTKPLVNFRNVDRDHNEPTDSISHLLNKTAKKNDIRGLNDTLNKSRHDSKGDKTTEEDLKSKRTNTPDDVHKSREELLSGLDREDWGYEYSDEEFEGFLKDLGLDATLEDSRNEYKVGE